jgi:hypothetical protein
MDNRSELRNKILDAMGGRTRGNRDLLSAYLDAIDEINNSKIDGVINRIQRGLLNGRWIMRVSDVAAILEGLKHE